MEYLLTLTLSGECNGKLYVNNVQYTGPVLIEETTSVHIQFIGDPGCCFVGWEEGGMMVSTDNPYVFVMPSADTDFICHVEGCCTPRYKDIDTLLEKANCICSWIGVEFVADICPGVGYGGFVLFDRCQIDDDSPLGTGFHEILVIFDPHYLLAIIECLCGQQRTSSHDDYIPTPGGHNRF